MKPSLWYFSKEGRFESVISCPEKDDGEE